ncbi:MAG: hypothetical protein ACYDD1_09255 [Caulobacteraceae bacterium]
MADHGFYDAGPLKQVAINLFYGWGYNFYRKENQLRADDQLVRAKAAWLLGTALAKIELAEAAYRRDHLPAPSRANPYPDPAAMAQAQALERLARAFGGLAARIHAQPTPENDRMTQRYRQEAATLEALTACDEQLIGQCKLLRTLVEDRDGAALLQQAPILETGMAAVGETLRRRQDVLLGPV